MEDGDWLKILEVFGLAGRVRMRIDNVVANHAAKFGERLQTKRPWVSVATRM